MEPRRHLPQEIIHEILTRASVKSLLRFKCVSKSWCTLISDESFVKAHLFKSSKDRTFVCVKPAKSYDKAPPLWSPPLLSCEPLYSYSYLYDQWLGLLERAAPVVRSCGGLVCCFSISGKDFTLWNPSTRKCRKLPSVDFEKGIDGSPTSCGFGYVESNDDYKVFALSLQQRIEGAYHCVAKVYSLKTDGWRTVDDKYELKTPMDLTARHLGGMLYWLRPFVIKGNRFRWEIISFDLEKEAFGITVEQPGEDLVDGSYTPQLGVLHDNLCMLCSSVTGDIVILQLKQHTWTRMATVPLPYSRGPRFPTNLLGVGSNGSILRAHDLHIVLCYRPNPTFIRRLWIDDFDILNRACAHVESLVSLGNPEEDAGTCDSVRNLEMVNRAEHRRWWLIMT